MIKPFLNARQVVLQSFSRPGCKADYICLKIMNASGPGQSPGRGLGGQRSPEAEAFWSQSMPKTQSPGTLALNHVYFLYSNNN